MIYPITIHSQPLSHYTPLNTHDYPNGSSGPGSGLPRYCQAWELRATGDDVTVGWYEITGG